MPSKERITYLFQRFFDKTCTTIEREELMKYVVQAGNEGPLKELIDHTWRQEFPAHEQEADRADEIFRYITEQQQKASPVINMKRTAHPKKWLRYAVGAAAVLLIVAGIYRVMEPAKMATVGQSAAINTYRTGIGEVKEVQLPDGSRIKINANSTLELAPEFNRQNREVTLTGEAFFEVTHNASKPFIIHTNKMDVKVLGTTFNVKAYPDDQNFETSLIKGSVEVTCKAESNRKVVLRPNEKITIANREPVPAEGQLLKPRPGQQAFEMATVKPVTIDKKDSSIVETNWTDNKLSFSNDSFEDIARKIERWYGVSVHFENEAARKYRFTITIGKESLDLVMKALQLSISGEYEYEIDEQNKVLYIR